MATFKVTLWREILFTKEVTVEAADEDAAIEAAEEEVQDDNATDEADGWECGDTKYGTSGCDEVEGEEVAS